MCIFIILRHNVLLFFPFVVSSISAGVLNIWLLQFIVFFFSFKFLSIPFSRITWMLMWKLCAFAHSGWCCACCSIIILTHTYIFPLSFLSLSMFVLSGLGCWIAQLIAYNYNSFIQILLLYKYTELTTTDAHEKCIYIFVCIYTDLRMPRKTDSNNTQEKITYYMNDALRIDPTRFEFVSFVENQFHWLRS